MGQVLPTAAGPRHVDRKYPQVANFAEVDKTDPAARSEAIEQYARAEAVYAYVFLCFSFNVFGTHLPATP